MLTIKLLGRPALFGDGVELEGPRGKKSWGLLTYLVSNAAAVPRERLVRLLFPDAQDGLASLRWNLAELRRITREPHAFAGDPVTLSLTRDVQVDVHLLAAAPQAPQLLARSRRPNAAIARASVKHPAAMGVVVGFQPAGDSAPRTRARGGMRKPWSRPTTRGSASLYGWAPPPDERSRRLGSRA